MKLVRNICAEPGPSALGTIRPTHTTPLSLPPPFPLQQQPSRSSPLRHSSRHRDTVAFPTPSMQTQDRSDEAPAAAEEAGSPENHNEQAKDGEGSDSDGSPTPRGGDENGYVLVKSADVRKQVQCPICLGIIRRTRTVMECLHRFCRVCIDKSMRMGNNECPACRTHCPSRRSLRDDPNFDALISILYPDIDKFEEEEFAFGEEEEARNKQVQASIAQVRQSQTPGRKRVRGTDTAATFVRKSQRKQRNLGGRRNLQDTEPVGGSYDDYIDGRYDAKVLSSADEYGMELKPKRCKRWVTSGFSQPTSAATNADIVRHENYSEMNRFSWGKGGMRSHTRHGNSVGGRTPENSRISKLISSLQNSEESDDQVTSLMLVSLSEQKTEDLQCPYLSCSSAMPVRHLKQYVALHTSSHPEEIEMLLVESDLDSSSTGASATDSSNTDIQLRVLKEQDTLAAHQPMCSFSSSHLLVGYQHRPDGGVTGNAQ